MVEQATRGGAGERLGLSEACEVEEITALAALEELRCDWESLWMDCPAATPFQSPAWLIPWWRHFGYGELWTLAARDRGRLVGLLPVQSHSGQVTFLGTGISDYLDALVAPGFERTVTRSFYGHLLAHPKRWTACDFQQLRPGSPLLSHKPANLDAQSFGQEPCPMLDLPETLDDLPRRVPDSWLAKVAYGWRRAAKMGCVQAERATADNFERLLSTFLTLHGARWSERGQTGVLADASFQSFHRESGAALLGQGKLRLFALSIDAEPAAALYGFLHNGTFFYYLGGFDPKFRTISPGSLIIHHAIKEAIGEGARTFDFLRGREAYKYAWGAKDTPICCLRFTSPGEGR